MFLTSCTYLFSIHVVVQNVEVTHFIQVQGAVFDLSEEIAKELLNKQLPPGNTISKITEVVLRSYLWLSFFSFFLFFSLNAVIIL